MRSGWLWLGLVGIGLVACRKPQVPEADPEKIVDLAKRMMASAPPPGFRDCTPAEVMGGATLTQATLYKLTATPLPPNPKNDGTVDPKLDTWTNPDELVSPAALALVTPKTDGDRRRAAAELLAAPFYLVYRVDLIDAPMALGFKEPKRGTIGARAIRYNQAGAPVCVRNFAFQNDLARNERAIARSDKAEMDPQIVEALRLDLKEQMLRTVTSLGASRSVAPSPGSAAAKPVEDDGGDDEPAKGAGSTVETPAGSAAATEIPPTPVATPPAAAAKPPKPPEPPAGSATPEPPSEPPPAPLPETGSG